MARQLRLALASASSWLAATSSGVIGIRASDGGAPESIPWRGNCAIV
jgi:hypothetical protein